eukprot:CAMPEP_0171171192 /NCGR_PEP_ID=MMETSP0790-20130122/9092_1 /TAXON_ID=2925 /ORGANISM="Alexandrium catenella, Strain OF101" /LENGTH=106 /DNA_ID=CAMNT_0011636041 /DNA_START=183 /DNA_END=500 /DNA_ORIENTATION=-
MPISASVESLSSAAGSAAAFEPVSFWNLPSCSSRKTLRSSSAFSFAWRSLVSRFFFAAAMSSSPCLSACTSCWMSSCDLLAAAIAAALFQKGGSVAGERHGLSLLE